MNNSGTTHDRSIPGAMTETAEAYLDAIKVKLGNLEGMDTRKPRKNPCKGHRWYRAKTLIKVPDEQRYVESFVLRDSSMAGEPKLIHHAYYYCKLCSAHELVGRIVGTVNGMEGV
jgi:hypothetical protein